MTEREIKERIIWLLELEGGEWQSSGAEISEIIGEHNLHRIAIAIAALAAEGLIRWKVSENQWGLDNRDFTSGGANLFNRDIN
ncbi:MAG: hypothetical protein PHE84_00460 [bacterium]|nr:hypothetical protein [bacterium]